MIRKYTYAIGLLTVLSLLSFSTQAREKSYKGNISVTPVRLEQRGDSLYVDMNIQLSGVRVKSPLSVDLTPWLSSSGRSSALPVISVKGRNNYKTYERSLTLDGKSPEAIDNYIVLKGYGESNTTIRYAHVLRYEPWMADAGLSLRRDDAGCSTSVPVGMSLLADHITLEEIPVPVEIPKEIVPLLAFATPEAEEVKNREIQAEVKLDFVVNRTEIDPTYMSNPRELAKLREMIDELRNDASIMVSGLEIIGYASPEGSLANNKRLSEGRAMALRDYLASRYDFSRSIYAITFGGENWDGLVKELENYPLEYKNEVLSIIEFNADDQQRKSRLMNLRGGAPYREMLRNIYPGLRTAVCVVDYVIKGFTAEDAAVVFRTRPQNLSLNEFYLVANRMEPGSPEFVDVFETAVRMYPEDDVANLNAAVAALQNGNRAGAERYLAKIEQLNLPEYNNAKGVLAVLNNDFPAAERFFRLAAAAGLEIAERNLEMLP